MGEKGNKPGKIVDRVEDSEGKSKKRDTSYSLKDSTGVELSAEQAELFSEDVNASEKTKFALKSSSETVTMSKGEAQKRKANYESDRVYTTK